LSEQHAHALAEERARIARDLHDDLGTALTGVALELDVARRQSGDGIANRLGETAHNIRTLAERMREVVWAVNPNCDTVSSLASFLEQQAGLLLKHTPVRARFEFPEELPTLSVDSETRHQLALGVREAITNALRHAQASEIAVSLSLTADLMNVSVRDNGCGFDATIAPAHGNGLRNLRARLARLGGDCDVRSTPGAGTCVEFRVCLARSGKGKESK
jgi:signal transduction histidine kinase